MAHAPGGTRSESRRSTTPSLHCFGPRGNGLGPTPRAHLSFDHHGFAQGGAEVGGFLYCTGELTIFLYFPEVGKVSR